MDYKEHMRKTHIPTRNFHDSFSLREREEIKEKYIDDCWLKAKASNDDRRKITKSAVRIAEVMKEKMGISLFPCIRRIACKGFDINGGTLAFSMVNDKGEDIYFCDRAATYKSMKKTYRWEDGCYEDNVITSF